MILARGPSFRQIHPVRWLSLVVVTVLAAKASAAPSASSNPSFLGIEMSDFGGGCSITSVTNCSPAQDAGLRFGDFIVAMDGKPLLDVRSPASQRRPACDVLREQIMAHAPGDVVSYDVRRGPSSVTINATLSTRADVQHRCFVGQSLPSVEAADIDNPTRELDLAELHGKTTVLAWFRLELCVGCGAVLDRIADGITKRVKSETTPDVIGVTYRREGADMPKRMGFGSTLPVLVADEKDFRDLTLKESERIQVMVVDCRGIVRFVTPLAPGSEDLQAGLDEVLAAVEQAEYERTQRR